LAFATERAAKPDPLLRTHGPGAGHYRNTGTGISGSKNWQPALAQATSFSITPGGCPSTFRSSNSSSADAAPQRGHLPGIAHATTPNTVSPASVRLHMARVKKQPGTLHCGQTRTREGRSPPESATGTDLRWCPYPPSQPADARARQLSAGISGPLFLLRCCSSARMCKCPRPSYLNQGRASADTKSALSDDVTLRDPMEVTGRGREGPRGDQEALTWQRG
jgi:hypothetical protein